MDADRELDLAKLMLRKDEAIAIHGTRVGGWRIFQAAIVSSVGLAYLGLFARTLGPLALMGFAALAASLIVVAQGAIGLQERDFEAEMRALRGDIERLKRRRLDL